MISHLTIRMAWHDNNWDGCVCQKPELNSYCVGTHSLLSERLAKNREIEIEQENCGAKADSKSLEDYLPPCYWTINAFGSKNINVYHEHPISFTKVDPIADKLKPYSVFTWPFKLSFVHSDKKKKKHGDYWPDREFEKRIRNFLDKLSPKESIIFFYCNYDNPVSADDHKYLLLGCSLLKSKSDPDYFVYDEDRLDEIRSQKKKYKNFPAMNWALQFTHDFKNNGILLPYKDYLKYCDENPEDEDKIDEMKVIIEDPSLVRGFKYVAMDIDDDKTIYLLYKLRKSLLIAQDHGISADDVEKQLATVNRLLEKTWKRRGLYPSFPRIISLILDGDEDSAYGLFSILRKNYKEKDLMSNFIDIITKESDAPDFLDDYEEIIDELIDIIEDKPSLAKYIQKLSLFNLTNHQLAKIINSPEDAFYPSVPKIDGIFRNPYLLCEYYSADEPDLDIPETHDEPVDLFKVDIGLFPDRKYLKKNKELQNLTPGSPERLRPLIVEYLYSVGEKGDCYCDSEAIIDHIYSNPIFYKEKLHIEEELIKKGLGKYEKHFNEKLSLRESEGRTYYYLNEVIFAEKRIAAVFNELTKKTKKHLLNKKYFESYIKESTKELSKKIPNFDMTLFREERLQLFSNIIPRSLFILTGIPGSGKTYEISKVYQYLTEEKDEDVTLLAPTGKASLRLAEKIREITGLDAECFTIDRFIARNGYYDYLEYYESIFDIDEENKLQIENLVIDESSMVDLFKFAILFSIIRVDKKYPKRIVLVGDENQLPPIGFGKPFVDLIENCKSNRDIQQRHFVKLQSNCRQENDENILRLAEVFSGTKKHYEPIFEQIKGEGRISEGLWVHHWKNGEELYDKLEGALDEVFELEDLIDEDDGETSRNTLLNLLFGLYDSGYVNNKNFRFRETLKIDNLQLISPYRPGYFGTMSVNQYVQDNLRGENEQWRRGTFVHSDKIIRIKNWYRYNWETKATELFLSNGSLGIYNSSRKGDKYFFVETERPFKKIDENDLFELAYAITVHKSQGSDFRNVFAVIPEKRSLLSRELIYTELTRSRFRLFLFVHDVEKSPLEIGRNRSFVKMRRSSIFTEPEDPRRNYQPDRGIFVKSRVEYIIYKLLESRSVNFKYEEELKLPNRSYDIHPDFSIRLPNGKKFYWEHLGMLSDKKYVDDWMNRKEDYRSNNLFEKVVTTDDLGGIVDGKIVEVVDDILGKSLKRTEENEYSNYHYQLY